MITLAVAGLTLAVTAPPIWEAALCQRFAAFAVRASPTWLVALRHDPTLPADGEMWVRHDGPVTAFCLGASTGEIDLAAGRAWVCAGSAEQALPAVERVLSYILMQALPRRGDALLLHAAGIVIGGRGYVFAGPSAAGKTTVAGLAGSRGEVLCDENVVVACDATLGWQVFSTPFWGHSTPPEQIRRLNCRAPLHGIYLLKHATAFRRTRLSPAEAVVALLSTEKVAVERPESAEAWLAVAGRLVTAVPVYRLEFRPTTALWDFLEAS